MTIPLALSDLSRTMFLLFKMFFRILYISDQMELDSKRRCSIGPCCFEQVHS